MNIQEGTIEIDLAICLVVEKRHLSNSLVSRKAVKKNGPQNSVRSLTDFINMYIHLQAMRLNSY